MGGVYMGSTQGYYQLFRTNPWSSALQNSCCTAASLQSHKPSTKTNKTCSAQLGKLKPKRNPHL